MHVSVNTYGVRDLLYQDFTGTLKALKAAQLDAAEVCIFFWNGDEPSETVKAFLDNPALERLFAGIWPETVAGENWQHSELPAYRSTAPTLPCWMERRRRWLRQHPSWQPLPGNMSSIIAYGAP